MSKKAAAVALRILDGEKAATSRPSDRPRIAEIRLATNAALWDQRERPSAGKHGFLKAAYGVGNLPLADVVTVCTVLLLQAVLIALLLLERQRRRSAEIEVETTNGGTGAHEPASDRRAVVRLDCA